MDETSIPVPAEDAVVEAAPEPKPLPKMAPIRSRFLYVDVAAQRAKQLRRGALPRLAHLRPDPETGARPEMPPKLERVAMQEVEEGLVVYELPDKPPVGETAR
ncbi:MAG: DNA-directed RNA polymerase subunit omega [Vicinamibacterales bacterium]|jgi:DNA-directed RNA polymerase subunit K/omega|nr:DNA-directed RNA polymerase subunit omega [Vicinamibacterales bacterium]|tara:strand:+ start:1005 stop:1313 length:309 start_codon:yes stop_codon:yes gene_type:complete